MKKNFRKKLGRTDVTRRLSVPSKNKECFLDFGERNMVKFEVTDDNGKPWSFSCSKRTKGKYPKPVLIGGWLSFVRQRKLTIGDEVALCMEHDKAGKRGYRIKVIKKADQPSVENHDSNGTMETASYNYTEEEPAPTITSDSTDQAITDDQTEGVHYPPVTDMVGSILVIANPEPHGQVRELQYIDFFERAKEQPSPTTSSIQFFQFF